MKLKPLGNNKNELELSNGTTVLFSYQTPVAVHIPGQGWFKTSQKWSVTTSKHIGQWCKSTPQEKPQAWFDSLIKN